MNISKYIIKHDIKTNSKKIRKGDVFICALGNIDKHKYINEAIENGASLVIGSKKISNQPRYYRHHKINSYLKKMLDMKYHYPLLGKTLIGITGTDGKTTTASIIRYMLKGASIGTNGLEFSHFHLDTINTTPSLDSLYYYFNIINKQQINNIAMEVSSESYLTNRIPNLKFNVGIFLNISKEHLDKHKNFYNYLKCKKKLLLNSQIKIINRDCKYYNYVIKGLKNYLTFGYQKSDLQVLKYQLFIDKTKILFKYQNHKYMIISPLVGKYNIDNLMAAILTLLALNYDINDIIKRIHYIKKIPGRMELLEYHHRKILIDYAHTIHATIEVLKFVKQFYNNIITVVGCAGGRYQQKRKDIGKIVTDYSSLVIFTSDDPRWENPQDIISDMLILVKKKNYYIIVNRREAIKLALNLQKNEVIVILGKGRDNYMAINDEKIPYSDIDVINKFLTKE